MKRFLSLALVLVAVMAAPAAAVTRRAFPGGEFPDCLPGGQFAVPLGANILTHAGPVPVPEVVMFTRATDVGGFRFAVQSHDTDRVWTWDGAWHDTGRLAHGVEGFVWTDTGDLFVIAPCRDCDSQGVRYWNAGPILGSPTYNPFTEFAALHGVSLIYEWTVIDGIAVGQGADGGAVIQYRGKHYLLEPGDARFLHFHKRGDTLSVAITKLREREAVCCWLSVSEIEALPAYVPIVVPPLPTPPPPPPVDPLPPTSPPAGPDQKATVETIRKKYPTPLGETHWRFLVEVAQAVGGRLFRKDGGDKVFVPPLNLSVSQDIIIVGSEWIDILGDGERSATPSWDAHPNAGEPEKWIDVRGIVLTGTTPPPPPPDDVAALKERIRIAEADVARQAGLIGRLEQLVITERADASAEQARLREESTNKGAQIEDLKAQLANRPAASKCEVRGVPGWARGLGVRPSCVLVQ